MRVGGDRRAARAGEEGERGGIHHAVVRLAPQVMTANLELPSASRLRPIRTTEALDLAGPLRIIVAGSDLHRLFGLGVGRGRGLDALEVLRRRRDHEVKVVITGIVLGVVGTARVEVLGSDVDLLEANPRPLGLRLLDEALEIRAVIAVVGVDVEGVLGILGTAVFAHCAPSFCG